MLIIMILLIVIVSVQAYTKYKTARRAVKMDEASPEYAPNKGE